MILIDSKSKAHKVAAFVSRWTRLTYLIQARVGTDISTWSELRWQSDNAKVAIGLLIGVPVAYFLLVFVMSF